MFDKLAAAAFISLSLAACSTQIGAPQASMSAIETIRGQTIPAINVGEFVPGPNLSPSDDKSVTIRAINNFKAPGGSFAGALRDTLTADLRAAGRFDSASPYVLQGTLNSRNVDSSIGTGTASLDAKFTLLKGGKPVFDKDLAVSTKWNSSFIGAVAIPDAINNFTGLYEKLSLKLFSDPDLKAAFDAH